MSWVWDQSRSRKTDRLVLLAIADCCSEDGSNAYPSMAELKRKTGLSERAIQASFVRLVGLGELFVGRNLGPRGCNRYRVIMAPADPAPPQEMHPAGSAGVRTVEAPQVNATTPADPAPPAESAPPQRVRRTPADPAPGTVREPSENSSTKSSSRTRGTRIPDDFGISREMRDWATDEIPGFSVDREHMRFRDYWRSAPGSKGVKVDWPATWRNWMRRAAEQTRPGGRAQHQPYRNPDDVSAYYGDL